MIIPHARWACAFAFQTRLNYPVAAAVPHCSHESAYCDASQDIVLAKYKASEAQDGILFLLDMLLQILILVSILVTMVFNYRN